MKLALAMLLVPSLALADVPPPAPIPLGPTQEPTSPIAAQPAGGYTVLPALPSNPSRGRKIAGGVIIAGGIALTVIGIALLAARPRVPSDLGAPGWYDAQSTYDTETVGGLMLIGGGVVAAAGGTFMLATPSAPYGELPGAPLLTF